MGSWINIIKEICHNLFVEVTKKFCEYDCKGMNYKMEVMWLKIGSVDLELPLII